MATNTYTYSEILGGFSGYFDDISTENKRHFAENAVWSCIITGTEAVMEASGGGGSPFHVSVDGVMSDPSSEGGLITLFTGLSDTPHHVSLTVNYGYLPIWHSIPTDSSTNLRVTGTAPAIELAPVKYASWPDFVGISTCPEVAAPGGNYTPSYPQCTPSTTARGELIIRTQCDSLYILTDNDVLWYSVDGGTPQSVSYDSYDYRILRKLSSSLDGSSVHTYTIWSGSGETFGIQGVLALYSGTVATLLSAPSRSVVYQFGDSITAGVGATLGQTDTWLYGLENEYAVCSFGAGGQTTAELTALIPTYFDESPVPDYVVLAIGRNDVGSGAFETNYSACLDAFINEGVTNIICRGQLPGTLDTENIATMHTSMQSVIASKANPNIVFMDTADWAVVSTTDTVHPDASGYIDIASDMAEALLTFIEAPSEESDFVFPSNPVFNDLRTAINTLETVYNSLTRVNDNNLPSFYWNDL